MYAGGSAGANATYHANRNGLDKYAIIPRMLVNANNRSLDVRLLITFSKYKGDVFKTTIFGVKCPSPIFIAPIGVQATFHGDAEFPPTRAGQKFSIPFITSAASFLAVSNKSPKHNGDGYQWYKLYWSARSLRNYKALPRPRTNDITLLILARAKSNSIKAPVVTLDTMMLG